MKKGNIEITPNNSPADARVQESKPGYKSGNEFIDEIVQQTRNIQNLMDKELPIIRSQIERIIKQEISSSQEIETLLDILLNYSSFGKGEQEFQKLNNYYAKIHSKNSEEYNRFLKEIKK